MQKVDFGLNLPTQRGAGALCVLTHRKRLGLMSKLFDFPDDRTEEAETAHRSPRTPSSHECEPTATSVSQKGHFSLSQRHE